MYIINKKMTCSYYLLEVGTDYYHNPLINKSRNKLQIPSYKLLLFNTFYINYYFNYTNYLFECYAPGIRFLPLLQPTIS